MAEPKEVDGLVEVLAEQEGFAAGGGAAMEAETLFFKHQTMVQREEEEEELMEAKPLEQMGLFS